MESANSGSMQSSSNGGDDQEDFDSSTSFFNNPPPNLPTTNTHFLTHQTTTFLNPQHTFPQSNDMFWSKGLSQFDQIGSTNYPDFGNFTEQGPSSSVPPPPAKNPKKRTRASHRAPTTVLTTDTANFRQMVQEFTGIPATPFVNSRSLDLFSALRPGSNLDGLGPIYPLRAEARKVLAPFSSSSSASLLNPTMVDSVVSTANVVGGAAGLGGAGSNDSNSYQLLPSDYPFNGHDYGNQFDGLSGFRSRESGSARDNDDLHQQ